MIPLSDWSEYRLLIDAVLEMSSSPIISYSGYLENIKVNYTSN